MNSFVVFWRSKCLSADVFRITITSFLDAYNFDVRRLMKCCIHHVLPSGHIISILPLQCSVPGRTRAIACTPLASAPAIA